MDYAKIGALKVSRICLGCMGFGDAAKGHHTWTLSEEASQEIIHTAIDNGVNFFDTAAGYQSGTSEQFLGRILEDVKREDMVIATKFFPNQNKEFSGRKHIETLLDKSLVNLRTNYIDLYILHAWDYITPIEETMETLHNAVMKGKIREIGISNCFAWQLCKANSVAVKNGWKQFISMQGHYNLIHREEEREMLPYCRSENITYTPYSPLASGRLVKPLGETSKRLTEDTYAMGKYQSTEEQDSVIISRVAEIARRNGLTNTQVALGWLLTKATVPIVGATKIKHITEAIDSVGVQLTEDEIHYLEETYIPHKLVGVMANRFV